MGWLHDKALAFDAPKGMAFIVFIVVSLLGTRIPHVAEAMVLLFFYFAGYIVL